MASKQRSKAAPPTPVKRPAVRIREAVNFKGARIEKGIIMVTMDYTEEVVITIQATDQFGDPGLIQGPPTWAVDPTDVVTLQVSADGLTCTVLGVNGQTGAVSVTPTAIPVNASGVAQAPISGRLWRSR